MEDCIFCKIGSGKIPSYKIWEDANYVAFLDIHPESTGMTLVIPKKHLDSYIFNVEKEEVSSLLTACKTVSRILEKVFGVNRVKVVFEGLQVSHLHAKLNPLFPNHIEPEGIPSEVAQLINYVNQRK
jgi:histidine triad (HIT) family protein